ncbi:hypothetical protein ABZX65_27105 [Streptomyces sp. NPDC003300]|uniref:hypothetical protein n=1 Tax=unclassified Streptomyces TaxID=2593676 RepID=UPI0033B315C2
MRAFLRRAVASLTHSGPGLPQPARGDAFETWLKDQRDKHEDRYGRVPAWYQIDDVLDQYRLHADTRTPLDQHACTGPHCDCKEAA